MEQKKEAVRHFKEKESKNTFLQMRLSLKKCVHSVFTNTLTYWLCRRTLTGKEECFEQQKEQKIKSGIKNGALEGTLT